MAEGYGRQGVAVGGKGGTKIGGAYEFGAKSAGEYLSGNLASEYTKASSALRSDLVASGQNWKIPGQLVAKREAKENIGKLRDIAQASAVGEFLGFAGSKGRGSQATASQGLITGESYSPESTVGIEAAKKVPYHAVPSDYGKAMYSASGGYGAHNLSEGITNITAGMEFAGQRPVSYAEAAMGKTGSLHRKLEAGGQAVETAKSLGATSSMFLGMPNAQTTGLRSITGVFGNRASLYSRNLAAQKKQPSQQSILAMTPAERYFRGISS